MHAFSFGRAHENLTIGQIKNRERGADHDSHERRYASLDC
jgi:hypothetical protein